MAEENGRSARIAESAAWMPATASNAVSSRPLQLGAAANLLHGLRPEWMDDTGTTCPFLSPPRQPFVTFDLDVTPSEAASWCGPTLSVHDQVEDLIDAIFEYRVLPFQADSGPFRLPASALMLRPEDRVATLDALSRRLGLELSSGDGGGYLLLRLRRETGDFMHEAERGGVGRFIQIKNYWTREGRHAMGRLRTGERVFDGPAREAIVTARQAERYLEYCYEFGTHFVSRVTVGDLILQAFACRPLRYRQMKETFTREANGIRAAGALALSLGFFLGPEWVSERGAIVSSSHDPALARTLAAGAWHDTASRQGDSILAPFAGHPKVLQTLLMRFSRIAPISIAFTPQSSFMEVFRSGVWARILKGALLQRYGTRIRLPLREQFSFPDRVRVPKEFALPGTSLQTEDGFTAFGLTFELGQRSSIAGKRVAVCAYRAAFRPEAGTLPLLALGDEALAGYEFVTGEMHGGLFVSNRDGSRRETLYEGFRFVTEREPGADGGRRVALRGDLQKPSAELLSRMSGPVRCSLEFAETLLLYWSSSRPEDASFVRGYLEWLAAMTAGREEWQALRVRLLYLARVAGWLAPQAAPIDTDRAGALVGELAGITQAVAGLATQEAPLSRQLLACGRQDLHADRVTGTAPAPATFLLESVADALGQAADRANAVCEALRLDGVGALPLVAGSADPLGKPLEAACARVVQATEAILGSEFKGEAPSLARTILATISTLLSPEPTGPWPPRLRAGDTPLARFWQLVAKIQNAWAATDAVELLGSPEESRALERAEALLDALEGPVAIPTERDWQELAALVTALLDSSMKQTATDDLKSALLSLSTAGVWLQTRAQRAQRLLDRAGLSRERASRESRIGAPVTGSAANQFICEKGRLLKAIVRLEQHLNAGLLSVGLTPAVPPAEWDLPALTRSLARQVQSWERHHQDKSVTGSPRLNASDT